MYDNVICEFKTIISSIRSDIVYYFDYEESANFYYDNERNELKSLIILNYIKNTNY